MDYKEITIVFAYALIALVSSIDGVKSIMTKRTTWKKHKYGSDYWTFEGNKAVIFGIIKIIIGLLSGFIACGIWMITKI
jgi:hypothetical protein